MGRNCILFLFVLGFSWGASADSQGELLLKELSQQKLVCTVKGNYQFKGRLELEKSKRDNKQLAVIDVFGIRMAVYDVEPDDEAENFYSIYTSPKFNDLVCEAKGYVLEPSWNSKWEEFSQRIFSQPSNH